MVVAAFVVNACAGGTPEPKAPDEGSSEPEETTDNSGLSDEEFWEKVEEEDKDEAAEAGDDSEASNDDDPEDPSEDEADDG
jgi:hypothetical protein